MIDLSKIAYRLTVMDSGGKQYNIKEFVTGLGWEENKNEISVRTSFTAKNDKTSAGRLSELIKPGCLIGIFASDGGKQDREVARGTVQEWNPQEQSSSNTLKCVAYGSHRKDGYTGRTIRAAGTHIKEWSREKSYCY